MRCAAAGRDWRCIVSHRAEKALDFDGPSGQHRLGDTIGQPHPLIFRVHARLRHEGFANP
jgi:hypothetical protein